MPPPAKTGWREKSPRTPEVLGLLRLPKPVTIETVQNALNLTTAQPEKIDDSTSDRANY